MEQSKIKSACCYIRVSTDDQIELSPDTQKQLIFDYCKKNGYLITNNDVFQDLGISGKFVDKRPQLIQMIARCKSSDHPYDAVIVWKFSRFARNREESVIYKRMLKKIGVTVISVSEPISDDIGGQIAEAIFEIMDEYYSINLAQEVKRGMKENARRGNYQSAAPIGYKRIEKGVYEIDEQQAKTVRYIFNKYLEVGTISPIALDLNDKGITTAKGGKWERKTVQYVLQNPFYIGKIRWNYMHRDGFMKKNSEEEWIIADGTHEPIISEEVFNKAQEIMKLNARPSNAGRRVSKSHWLSGIIKCADCGRSLTTVGTYSKGYKPRFVCIGYAHGQCKHSQSTRIEDVEKLFFDFIDSIDDSVDIQFVKNATVQENDLSDYYQNELKRIEQKEKRIKQAYRDGIDTIEEYKENKAILMSERENILSKMENVKATKNCENSKQSVEHIKQISDLMKCDRYSIPEKNEMLKEVIEKIVYDKDSQVMKFYFRM